MCPKIGTNLESQVSSSSTIQHCFFRCLLRCPTNVCRAVLIGFALLFVGNLIAEKSKFVRLLMDIGNLSVFLGLQSVRDGVFDVLFSLPVSSHYQGKLCDSLSSREGFSGFCEMLKRSPCELTLPTTTQSLSEFEFSGCTQQLYFLQVIRVCAFAD